MVWLFTVLALLGVAFGSAWLALRASLPAAIVQAPNAGKPVEEIGDPPDDMPSVPRHFRVAVGPPPASLSCFVLDPAAAAVRGTVLVLHGIRDRKAALLEFARTLASDGFRSVAVDLRGHGRSTGDWLTFGVVEARDLVQVVDALEERGWLEPPLAAVGFSYGGAVALQHAARDPRVRAVGSVAAFTSLRDVLKPYVRRFVPLVGALLRRTDLDAALAQASHLCGEDLGAASPLEAVQRTAAAVLIVHGDADAQIPVEQGVRLAEAAGGRARLVRLPDADHDRAMVDPAVVRELRAFLAETSQRGPPWP